ncbi:AGAP001181-PA-like protein [Anopheles sinensis]|uniref:AGAP001181-PA-like protein n=1 Tax=Anopheles sinensis TaxID=74873 RepID=A0A084W0G0_ANOSI|nr:AGAP001181-PA-like protein [Anopheles sinensis]
MRSFVTTIAVPLLFLLLAKTGLALDCDFCYGEEDCSLGRDVPVVTCDEESVQLTNGSLASFIRPLRTALPTTRHTYECVHVRATSVSGHMFLFVRGCVHRLEGAGRFCSLSHAAFQGSLECVACDGEDRCNNIPLLDAGSGSSEVETGRSLISLMCASLVVVSVARNVAASYS